MLGKHRCQTKRVSSGSHAPVVASTSTHPAGVKRARSARRVELPRHCHPNFGASRLPAAAGLALLAAPQLCALLDASSAVNRGELIQGALDRRPQARSLWAGAGQGSAARWTRAIGM